MKSTNPITRIVLVVCSCAALALTTAADDQKNKDKDKGKDRSGQAYQQSGADANSQLAQEDLKFIKDAAKGGMHEVKMAKSALEKTQNPRVKEFAQRLVTDHQKANQELQQIAAKKGVTLPPSTDRFAAQDPSQAGARGAASQSQSDQGQQSSTQQSEKSQPDTASTESQDDTEAQGGQRATESTTGTSDSEHKGKDHKDHKHQEAADHQEMQKMQSLSGTEFDRAFIEHSIKHHQKNVTKFEKASEELQDEDLKAFASKTLPALREHLRMAQALQTQAGRGTTTR